MLARSVLRRCPRCGAGRLFRRWFTMVDRCPGCGYRFAREEGSWLGAFVVNFALTEGAVALVLFALVFTYASHDAGGTTFSVRPFVVAAVALSVVVPIVAYPFTKTIWTAIDLIMHRNRPDDDLPE